jgi:hypothetical protein
VNCAPCKLLTSVIRELGAKKLCDLLVLTADGVTSVVGGGMEAARHLSLSRYSRCRGLDSNEAPPAVTATLTRSLRSAALSSCLSALLCYTMKIH